MYFITTVVDPLEILDKVFVASRRILVDDYPFISKEESKEILELIYC